MTIRILLGLLCVCSLCVSVVAEEPAPKKKPKELKKVAAVGGVVQLQAVKKADEARLVAMKKLVEAQKTLTEATAALAAAEKAAAGAQSDEEKAAATKQIEEAKQKLDLARKALAQQRAEVAKAAQAAVVVRARNYNVAPVAVRENVDPQDPIERFALLTPGGPLVVEVAMTIDGQPFRVAREKLVDELHAAADQDKDGKATWDEALKATRFTLNRVRIVNDQQRQSYIKMLDKNKNGLVDRGEVRQFLAQFFQGPAFTLVRGYGYNVRYRSVLVNGRMVNQGGGQADVRKLLDTDDNGVLDEKEIAAAPERLKSRDANDNDLLLPNEINVAARSATGQQVRAIARQAQPQLALLLGPTAKAESLFAAFQQHYKNEDGDIVAASFTALPKLFESLDENKDGQLQQNEVRALNETKPHIELVVELSQNGDAKGLKLKSLAPELVKLNESAETISVELPGIRVSLAANLAARTYDYSRNATAYLTRYDKDNNGYLDKDEMAGNLARQFALWDGDEDGKVFAKEIVASYTRMLAPQMSQVRASAANQGNILFQALDQSGDGRLSLREMRTAHEQIKTFDEDKDDRVARDEIPVNLSVTFGLGNAGSSVYRTATGGQGTNRPAAASDVPEWFTRMDRNGDGDVTLKEFLADEKEFKKLDSNDDGFIEPKEAKQAGSSK